MCEGEHGVADLRGRRVVLGEDLEAVVEEAVEPLVLVGPVGGRVTVDEAHAVLLGVEQAAAADGGEDDAFVERGRCLRFDVHDCFGQESA